MSISQSASLTNVQLSKPLILRGLTPGVTLSCASFTCLSITTGLSDSFEIDSLIIQNANSGADGGAIWANSSIVALTNVQLNNNAAGRGGGVFASGSQLVFTNVTFSNSIGGQGGAVFLVNSQLQASNCRFRSNLAFTAGGAILAVASSLTLQNTVFDANLLRSPALVPASSFVGGAAISATDCLVLVSSCIFTHNAIHTQFANAVGRSFGGGVFLYASTTSIQAAEFIANSADNGGALASLSVPSFVANMLNPVVLTSTISLSASTFTSNVAHLAGGALYIDSSPNVTASSCSFVNNSATSNGGAVVLSASASWLNTNTFTLNQCTAGSGGAVAVLGSETVLLDNTFTENATPDGGAAIFWGVGSAIQQPAAAVRPIISGSVYRSNTAAFGNTVASDPVVLSINVPSVLTAQAGVEMPPITVIARDALNQTVSSVNQVIAAGPLTQLGGVTLVAAARGVAVFDNLIARALPNTRFVLSFSMTSEAGSSPSPHSVMHIVCAGTLTSSNVLVLVPACAPGSFYDNVAGVCTVCPSDSTTTLPMQLQCVS